MKKLSFILALALVSARAFAQPVVTPSSTGGGIGSVNVDNFPTTQYVIDAQIEAALTFSGGNPAGANAMQIAGCVQSANVVALPAGQAGCISMAGDHAMIVQIDGSATSFSGVTPAYGAGLLTYDSDKYILNCGSLSAVGTFSCSTGAGISTAGYSGFGVKFTSSGTGNTFGVREGDGDGTNFEGVVCRQANNFSTVTWSVSTGVGGTNTTYYCPIHSPYLKFTVEIYSTGTVTPVAWLIKDPLPFLPPGCEYTGSVPLSMPTQLPMMDQCDKYGGKYSDTLSLSPSFSFGGKNVSFVAGDIVAVPGNAVNNVHMLRFHMGCAQSTAALVDVVGLKRTTAYSDGTSTMPAIGLHDSVRTGYTTQPLQFSAAPTSQGNIITSDKLFVASTTTPAITGVIDWNWDSANEGGLILHGTTEAFSVNISAATTGCDYYGRYQETLP